MSSPVLPLETVATLLDELGDSLAGLTQTESQDDWVEYGDAVLQATNKLVSTLVEPTMTENTRNLTTNHTEVRIDSVGPNVTLSETPTIHIKEASLDINLLYIANKSNGSASVALVALIYMETVLDPNLLHTETDTIKTTISRVVSISLPKTNISLLPGSFTLTLQHTMVSLIVVEKNL
ncbi:uncharacterized protein LOC122128795 isoform X2 [Clupea harengus]|nr:uncharacterized protein LOC122128795 isoform X2 [Clupea harengus]